MINDTIMTIMFIIIIIIIITMFIIIIIIIIIYCAYVVVYVYVHVYLYICVYQDTSKRTKLAHDALEPQSIAWHSAIESSKA